MHFPPYEFMRKYLENSLKKPKMERYSYLQNFPKHKKKKSFYQEEEEIEKIFFFIFYFYNYLELESC